MAAGALATTALKMKDTNTTATTTTPITPGQKNKPSVLATATQPAKKSPSDDPEIIEVDVENRKSADKAVEKSAKKGPDKSSSAALDTDKENAAANSGADVEDAEEDEGEGASPRPDEVAKLREISRRRKISDFITDRSYRVRSFLRRRGVPLTRILEMDIQASRYR